MTPLEVAFALKIACLQLKIEQDLVLGKHCGLHLILVLLQLCCLFCSLRQEPSRVGELRPRAVDFGNKARDLSLQIPSGSLGFQKLGVVIVCGYLSILNRTRFLCFLRQLQCGLFSCRLCLEESFHL